MKNLKRILLSRRTFLAISVLLNIILLIFVTVKVNKDEEPYIPHSTVRETIVKQIDTIKIEKVRNDVKYKEKIKVIIANHPNDDYKWLVQYLQQNRWRYDSICNTLTSEGD
jgi:hypothetical protein